MEEKDYKKLYLEQKTQCLNLEMSLIALRTRMIENEMSEVEAEFKEYDSKNRSKT